MISWANPKKVPLNLGEFGAFSKADIDSRIKWTAFIASQAVASKISFHYWEFCSGFGIYDLNTNKFNDGLLKALIPSS
jgi:endoglucanase